VNGEPRFVSSSSLALADNSSPQGCNRAWWYKYVQHAEDEQTEAQRKGIELHAEIERYLETGIASLSPLAQAGRHMMPDPVRYDLNGKPDLHVELDLVPVMPDGSSGLHLAPVRADGLPFVGWIDVLHERGINKGYGDITQTIDPPGTVEVIDWKRVKDAKYAKRDRELLELIQMVGYGKYVFATRPHAKRVRLSHGYFPQKGPRPFKTSVLADSATIDAKWEHANRVARSIREAAKETNPDRVPANTRACFRYGKDCPFRKDCTAGMHNSLADLLGETAADELLVQIRRPQPPPGVQMTLVQTTTEGALSGILGDPTPTGPSLTAEALAEQEMAARDPALFAVYQNILAYGKGMVCLGGEAAAAYARMKNIQAPEAGFAGSGDLGKWTITKRAQFDGLLGEIPKYFNLPVIAPVTAPAAPAAAAPPPAASGTATPVQVAAPPPAATPAVTGALPDLLPPDAPPQTKPVTTPPAEAPIVTVAIPTTPEQAQAMNAAAIAATTAQADAAPRARRGRPKKNQNQPTVGGTAAASTPVQAAETQASTGDDNAQTVVYVNAVPSCKSESLWPKVYELLHALGAKTGSPADDPRLADPESKMGYGRWKATLAAYMVEAGIPPGHWTLDNAYGDLAQAAVEAYRELALNGDIIMVWGTR